MATVTHIIDTIFDSYKTDVASATGTLVLNTELDLPNYFYAETTNDTIQGIYIKEPYVFLGGNIPPGHPSVFYRKIFGNSITETYSYYHPTSSVWVFSNEDSESRSNQTFYATNSTNSLQQLPSYYWDIVPDIRIQISDAGQFVGEITSWYSIFSDYQSSVASATASNITYVHTNFLPLSDINSSVSNVEFPKIKLNASGTITPTPDPDVGEFYYNSSESKLIFNINTTTRSVVFNTDFDSYKTDVASATATLLPLAGGTLTGNLTVNGTVSASSTIFSADKQVVTTNTTTVPGTSAVTSILAVSALPVVQEAGVLYIVI